jgi:phosphomannomutase
MRRFPASGEINRKVADIAAVLADVEAHYAPHALRTEAVDGLSVEYADWRFNLRGSNTEPALRLNVESRGDDALMRTKTDELLSRIGGSE